MEAGSGAAKSRGKKGDSRPAAEEEENPKGRGSVLLARKSGELCGGWSELLRGRRKWGNGEAAEGKKKIKNRGGAGGFFFLGLEIGLGLGCFFVFFLMFPKLTPLPKKISVAWYL
jgi:hypothetical protein